MYQATNCDLQLYRVPHNYDNAHFMIVLDQVKVENEQSELRVKDELATRMEFESPRRAACRKRSFRGYIEVCC